MGGIYLHIPFCKQACSYCDFYFTTTQRYKSAFVEGLLKEIELRAGFFPEETLIQTVYLGGGTPSLLENQDLQRIFDQLRKYFQIAEDAEITLEANPDDLSAERLKALKQTGINRLSIGIQSFRSIDLQLMNRAHSADQARNCVPLAQAAGFENLTIDLIYGIPGLTFEEWQANVQQAIKLGVPHISAYALTVEEKTLLHHQVAKGTVNVPPDEAYQDQYFYLIDALAEAEIQQYELSNFARPGFESRHNSAYWHGIPYLGLGPSAHSFMGNGRSWNVANLAHYLKHLETGQLPTQETEVLSPRDQVNEYIMTGLRLSRGIDLHHILETWGYQLDEDRYSELYEFFDAGWMEREGNWLRLTREGKMVSNEIISELFLTEDS